MSFRVRLIVFFVLIVALPMVALAVLVTQIASDSANGKTDARLDAGLRTATNLYDQARADSGQVANASPARRPTTRSRSRRSARGRSATW